MKVEYFSIKSLRDKSLLMLRDVKTFLENCNVVFWIDFGTLLGAICEGRSIVWDGDYDLCILDKDVSKIQQKRNNLEDLGYNISINENNIKIIKNEWDVGYYKVDIHRIKTNSNTGNYEYNYGYKLNSKQALAKKILGIIEIIYCEIPKYPEFDIITHSLLENGIVSKDFESIDKIKYIKGKINSPFEFCIQHDRFTIVKKQKKYFSLKSKILYQLLFILNNKLVTIIKNRQTQIIANAEYVPLKKFVVPYHFYDDLKNTIEFHSLYFKIPNNPEEHLVRLFGNNWKTPSLSHWRIKDDGAVGVE